MVANFVQTIDGVVAIPDLPAGNALIADGSEADRVVMGLLRACADVVLVGSRTMRASPAGTWQPERVYPPGAEAFMELRRRLGRPERPTVVCVTAGGSFDVSHPALRDGAIVLTTRTAADEIRLGVPGATEVVATNSGDSVDLQLGLQALRDRGHSLIVSEAGPSLFGQLAATRLVDELFLTVSPLLAGRSGSPRLGLVQGIELLPEVTRRSQVLSVRRHTDHLFLRYALR